MHRIPLTQICRRNGFCKENKLCSPSLRICEKNSYNIAIFQLLEDALNDPAHPLHDKAIANNPFIEIKDEPTTSIKGVGFQKLPAEPVKADICTLDVVSVKTEPFSLKMDSQLPL